MDTHDPKPILEQSLFPKQKPSLKRPHDDQYDWDDLQGYMNAKQRKRRNQFQDMKFKRESSIFEGICIYVNGWTEPSAEELKLMMHAHGGKYEYHLYSRSVVTHTIASNLPNSKIQNLGSSIVCTPDWIVDSIRAGTLLPVDNYLLYRDKRGQRKLPFSKPIERSEQGSVLKVKARKKGDIDVGQSHSSKSKEVDVPPKRGGDFVHDFFSRSRLHYLSVWSTELKQFTADMIKHITPKISKLPPSASLKGLNARALVHVDLDCFFVSVSLRDKPHLLGKPVAVTHAALPKQSSEDDSKRIVNPDLTLDSTPGSDSLESLQLGRLYASTSGSNSSLYNSTSDVASCSYEARDAGVSNGMSVGLALKKCPDLILLPYDFKSYREISQTFYEVCLHYSSMMEAVSCDEAYIELTECCRDFGHVSRIVRELRNEIQEKTGCTVSAGISHNVLLARMCTRVAKPDGQFYLSLDKVEDFLNAQKVRDLPGVGHHTANKLQELGIENCGELRSIPLDRLQSQFGTKIGRTLCDYSCGIDNRELKLTAERKSVSVDINFGIRFKDVLEAETLISSLSEELQRRAEEAKVGGNQITLKMKIRKQDAPMEPKKFLGHGACDNISRSMALLEPSREASECKRLAVKLLRQLKPVVTDIRGVGLQLSKLVSTDGNGGGGGGGVGGSKSLQKLLKKINKASSRHIVGPDVPLPDLKTEPPCPANLNLHTPSKTRERTSLKKPSPSKSPFKTSKKPSPSKSPFKTSKKPSPSKSPFKTSKKPPARKSLKDFFGSSSSSASNNQVTDETFAIELPPASQLDISVLDALPPSLCDEILKSYVHRSEVMTKERMGELCGGIESVESLGRDDPCTAAQMCPGDGSNVMDMSRTTELEEEDETIIVCDEDCFLKAWKSYICDWTLQSPRESDASNVSGYLRRLARSNLEMAELCLKFFRRLIVLQELLPWHYYFNGILMQVQEEVRHVYGGMLKITQF